MRKALLSLILLFPIIASAQFTIPQGGTGTTTIPKNYVLIGNSSLRITAVSTSSLGIIGTNYTATYPILLSGTTFSLDFGTTTANTWSALQVFNGNASTSAFTNSGASWFTGLTASRLLALDSNNMLIASTSIGTNLITGALGNVNTNSPLGGGGTLTVGGTLTLTCTTCVTSAGAWPWTAATNFASSTNSTTTPLWQITGIFASSTSQLVSENIWSVLTLKATTSALLATDAAGNVIGTSTIGYNLLKVPANLVLAGDNNGALIGSSTIGSNYISGPLMVVTTAAPLTGAATVARGDTLALACATCDSFGWPFVTATNFASTTYSTTTPQWDKFGIYASSTSQFVSENIWSVLNLKATTSALLATDNAGVVISTTTIGYNLIKVPSNSILAGDNTGAIIASSTIGVNLIRSAANSLLATDGSGNGMASTTVGTNYISGNLFTVTTAAPLGGAATVARGDTLALTCATCNTFGWPWTTATNFATTTNSTTTPSWYKTGVYASSTSQFVNANVWSVLQLEATTSRILATDFVGNVIASTSIGYNLLSGLPSTILAFNNSGTPIATTSIGVNYITSQANRLLATDNSGNGVASSSVGTNYITGNVGTINTNSPLGGGGALNIGTTLTLTCATCSAFGYPFSTLTNFATTTFATTTPFWGQFGIYGSSTSQFANANIWGALQLPATTSRILSTDTAGNVIASTTFGANLLLVPPNSILAGNSSGAVISSTTIGANLISGALMVVTTAAPLTGAATVNRGDTLALACAACNTYGYPFTTNTNFASTTFSTTTPFWAQFGVYASSTSNFTQLNIWQALTLKATTSALLAADAAGNVIASTTIGYNLIKVPASSILAGDNNGAIISSSTIGVNLIRSAANSLLATDGSGNGVASTSVGVNFIKSTAYTLHAGDASGNGVSTSTIGDTFLINSPVTAGSYTNTNLTVNAQGIITAASNGSAGAGSWPWTTATNFASSTDSTTTPLWLITGLFASSTSQLVSENIWGALTLKATTSSILATDANGVVIASTTIGVNLIRSAANSLLATDNSGNGIASTSVGVNYIKSNNYAIRAGDGSGNGVSSTTIGSTYLLVPPNALLAGNSSGVMIASTSFGSNLISGIMTVAQGGTGVGTLTGLLQGNGSSNITAVTGTAGQFPYFNAANTLLATSTPFLATTGFLGIGTTSPKAMLEVSASTTATSTPLMVSNFNSAATSSAEVFIGLRTDSPEHISGTTTASIGSIFQGTPVANKANGDFVIDTLNMGLLTERMRVNSSGLVGIGTSTLSTLLTLATSTGPQLSLWDGNGSTGWTFRNMGGIFVIASSTFSATSTGITFGFNSGGGIIESGMLPATSTTIQLDWATSSPLVEYRMGTANFTLAVVNATTSLYYGSRKTIGLCNPNATGGILTRLIGVEGTSTYTQVTTANTCDYFGLMVVHATSTSAFKLIYTGAITGIP